MPLPTEELIAINDLLIERETAFAQVVNLEDAISGILGQSYPLEPPKAVLPSTLKVKVKKSKNTIKKKPPTKLRRLSNSEVAYRVYYLNQKQRTHVDLVDATAVQNMLENPLPEHKVLLIKTLQEDLEIAEILYEENT